MVLESSLYESPEWLTAFLRPICTAIGLPKLAEVAHITMAVCACSFILQATSSYLSPKVFPRYYPPTKIKRDDWDLHMVGWIYSFIATPLALSLIFNPSPEIKENLLYGYGKREARLSAFATGYFIWDAIVSGKHVNTQGIGFLIHGVGCAIAFLFTLKPFLLYCGPNFLIWELSTIFLNFHWACDKFRQTGSLAQMINGVFLVTTYVGARIIWGTYNSYNLFRLLVGTKEGQDVGTIGYLYLGLNIVLNGLNTFWLRAMILALRKRFVGADPSARKEAINVDGKLAWKKR